MSPGGWLEAGGPGDTETREASPVLLASLGGGTVVTSLPEGGQVGLSVPDPGALLGSPEGRGVCRGWGLRAGRGRPEDPQGGSRPGPGSGRGLGSGREEAKG